MSNKQKEEERVLHMLSDFVNMRFNLLNNKIYISEKSRKDRELSSVVETPNRSSVSSTKTKDQKPAPRPKSLLKLDLYGKTQNENEKHEQDEALFRLKFLQRLCQEYLIIGNQYQIDMLKIGGIIDGFLDIEHKWSLGTKGVVHSISVQRKFSLIALGSKNQLWIYKYDLKKDQQPPKLVVNCSHSDQVKQVRFIKNAGIYIIMKSKLQFYRISWICQKAQFIKSFTYQYVINTNMSLFCIPAAWDNILNVYYHQKRTDSDKFNLWMQSFVSFARVQAPQVGKMVLIYSLQEELKDRIEISNFNSEICIIQFQNKLIAFKNGFVIDAVSTNIHQPSYFIKYIPNSKTLFHFLDNVIDIYSLSMIDHTKPQKFKLLCRDCVEFTHKKSGKLFNILDLGKERYAFFFQTALSRSSSNTPNITYRFAVSQPINIKAKLDLVYPTKQEITKFSFEQLYEKTIIAQKMGLSKRDAFLQLWLRSTKSTIVDFQVLLSTKHFPTIQTQIEHKLKRHSMSVRQILKIYTQCYKMLHQRVYSESCTLECLKQYTSCDFLIKKLDMLRWILSSKHSQQGTILINIKDYYQYKELSVIPFIIDLAYQYITKPNRSIILKLRGIFKYFSLICKMQYEQILVNLVKKCKLKILDLLKVLPELLPLLNKQENQLQLGLWKKISEEQLDQNIFLSQMTTIDNRQKVQQFPKNLWFKRYQYSSHGVIKDVDRKSLNTYLSNKNNPQSIFYTFLCKVYDLQIFNEQLTELISYVESKYELMPQHLKGKLQLYLIMYSVFFKIDQSLKLYPFLKLKQHELFKLYFDRQKIEKNGFILKKIKPLYEKLLDKGKQIFNQGIYQYFSSAESTVSDLKCILSKLNNEKNQFHINSQKLYEVLINAIMQKIKVGSTSDTPIDQILVYIENIPFPIHNQSIMTNLQYIQQINYESQMLQKIKANMTLSEIVKNGERVIQMMVDYQIQRHQMQRIKDYRSLRLHAYKILAEIQCRKSNIYGDKFHNYSFKIFLINVMNNIEMIPLCKQLLRDKYLVEEFQIDDAFKQSVVMHLYQWHLSLKKMDEANPYQNHLAFIKLLIDLLHLNNSKRKFIEASMQYAQIFTLPNYKIQYPLFPTFKYYPALIDIEIVLSNLHGRDLVTLDFQKIFNLMIELKRLGQAEMMAKVTIDGYENKLKIQLYEIYLIRLVEQRQLKLALTVAHSILDIPNQYSEFNIVYPVLILERAYQQVLENTAELFSRIISFSYSNPRELCNLLQIIYSNRFSNSQLDQLLSQYLYRKENSLAYNPSNPIFLDWMKDTEDVRKLNQILEICLQRMLKVNEAHRKNNNMQFIFRLMCHEPFTIAKWIWCKGSGINMKTLRSFVSYMSTQDLFDAEAVIKLTMESLQIISFKYSNNIFFSQILKYREHLLQTQKPQDANTQEGQELAQNKPLKLIKQSIRLLKKKRNQINNKQIEILKQKAEFDYKLYIKNPQMYMQKQLSEYIYSDKDDAYEDLKDEISIKSKWRSKVQSSQRKQSDKVVGNKIYQEIPLPTAMRPRKNSQYFPELLDISANFQETKFLKLSSSQKRLASNNFEQRYPQKPDKIPQEQAQQLSSLIQIKIDSQKGDTPPRLLQKMSRADSLYIQDEEPQSPQFSFKISVNKQKYVQPSQLVHDLLNTISGDSGVFDLYKLRIEARRELQFQSYLEKVLHHLYHLDKKTTDKCINLFNSIIIEYQQKCHLNKEAICIFRRIFQYKGIQYINFNYKEGLPVNMFFSQNINQFYDKFEEVFMVGINSIQVFSRLKFVDEVIGRQWKQRLLVALVLQKIKHVQEMRHKIGHNLQHEQQSKIIKELQMQQLKIGVLIDEDAKLITRLTRVSKELQNDENANKKELGLILKLSLSAIIDNY